MTGKINEVRRPIDYSGTHFPKQRAIALFIHRMGKIKRTNYPTLILDSLWVLYHELMHEHQDLDSKRIEMFEQVNFEVYVYDICKFVQIHSPSHYKSYHDAYSFEIDANLYGVSKTLEYFKTKGLLTQKIKERLEKWQARYLYDSNNYDLHYFLKTFNKVIQEKPEIDAEYISEYYLLDFFYNEDKTFKTIDEILELARFVHIDEKFLDYLFSSEDFLKSINFETLPQEHQQVIMNALKNVNNIDLDRRNKNNEFFQNRSINLSQWLIANIKISNKIARYTRIIDRFNKIMAQNSMNKSVSNESDLDEKRK